MRIHFENGDVIIVESCKENIEMIIEFDGYYYECKKENETAEVWEGIVVNKQKINYIVT